MVSFFELWQRLSESPEGVLYHGSNSEQINGPLRVNERDAGWFGTGFYLTAYPEYAQRWGKFIYQVQQPQGKFVEVQVVGNYQKINFLGDAAKANEFAGGTNGWIENEGAWATAFTNFLKTHGYAGVRVHFDNHPDVEVLVFDPSGLVVLGKVD